MKAISLPVNSLIIIVIALIVLIAIFGIFFGIWNPTKSTVGLDAATRTACQAINPISCRDAYKSTRIPIYNFDSNKNGNVNDHARSPTDCSDPPDGIICYGQDNFEMLCYNYYGGPLSLGAKDSPTWWSFINTCMVGICKCPKYPSEADYTG